MAKLVYSPTGKVYGAHNSAMKEAAGDEGETGKPFPHL